MDVFTIKMLFTKRFEECLKGYQFNLKFPRKLEQ